jgi:phospholipid-binding lipoprotein MlaA
MTQSRLVEPKRSRGSVYALLTLTILIVATLALGGCAENPGIVKSQNGIEIVETGDEPSSALADENEKNLSEDLFDPFDDDGTQTGDVQEYDPFEPVNSAIFEFNYRLDKYLVKPAAKVYNFFIPPDVQQSFSNLFQNIRFVPRLFNNLLQGKFKGAGIELSRFLINTTLGVGGLFDPAGIMFDLNTPPEDLGQTLGVYGMPHGPYIMVPILGPFTLRDGIGFIGDTFLDPFNWLVLPIFQVAEAPLLVDHGDTITFTQLGYRAGEVVNARALNLEKFEGVEEGTLDLYGAVRNAYYQQRLKALQE